jgi:hypothetical protein
MKFLTTAIVLGPLMLIGSPVGAADQSSPSGAPIQSAATSDSAASRDTYVQKAREDLQEWQQKLHDFSEKAQAKAQKDGDEAEKGLNAAWAKTEAEGHKLQDATGEGWENAKISYENASRELAHAWDKVRAQAK